MNQLAPPCRVAVTVVGFSSFKMTPTALLSTGLSPGDTDAAVFEGDGASGTLAAVGVLAGASLVADCSVSLTGAVREIVFFNGFMLRSSLR
jgi:hypothetical protein